ncbi:MAG: helix-turn-helix transcriptional regulator [Clostridia bacterium]|nr:helix-turn-helix transcriptional regulator [Clostridia bacterium]
MNIVLPEIVAIGIYNSQIAAKNKTITKNRRTAMFEIELPIESGGISYIDDEHMQILPTTIVCSKPGQTRHTKLPFKCYYIHMILKEGALYDLLMSVPNYLSVDNTEAYKEIFSRMCKYYDSAVESDKIMIYGLIFELLHLLDKDSKRQLRKEASKSNNHETIERVISYIKQNLTSDLSLDAVSAYANISPIHFHNCFKSATGRTLHQYVEEQRIKRAANLLITTDWTLTRISGECGFSSQSYFSYAFKRKMGQSPREYARQVYNRYKP